MAGTAANVGSGQGKRLRELTVSSMGPGNWPWAFPTQLIISDWLKLAETQEHVLDHQKDHLITK